MQASVTSCSVTVQTAHYFQVHTVQYPVQVQPEVQSETQIATQIFQLYILCLDREKVIIGMPRKP